MKYGSIQSLRMENGEGIYERRDIHLGTSIAVIGGHGNGYKR